jgi:UDP-N-acetylmuramate dehydrogenase
MAMKAASFSIQKLREQYGEALQENAVLANYTTAHVGGAARALLVVHSADELEQAARTLWQLEAPFVLIGSGSNLLVADTGYPGVVLVNRARNVKVDLHHQPPSVWAESGANIGTIARQAALRGLSGLEWAATVPGTLGGAVFGNAGAQGGDMASSLLLADILHPISGKEEWPVERLEYAYRNSALKRLPADRRPVVLAARLHVQPADSNEVLARMEQYATRRRATQPPGASLGSMFKNPAGDYAGRLIEAAGLKGTRVGGAQISDVHANFFVNDASATAADIGKLIALAQRTVYERFGVQLELEVELLGNWPALTGQGNH